MKIIYTFITIRHFSFFIASLKSKKKNTKCWHSLITLILRPSIQKAQIPLKLSYKKTSTKHRAFPIPAESILSYRSRCPRSRHNWVVLVKSLRRWLKSRRFLLRRKCFEDRKLSPLSDEMPARKWKGDLIMLIGLNVRTTRRCCKAWRLTLSLFSPFSHLSLVFLWYVGVIVGFRVANIIKAELSEFRHYFQVKRIL